MGFKEKAIGLENITGEIISETGPWKKECTEGREWVAGGQTKRNWLILQTIWKSQAERMMGKKLRLATSPTIPEKPEISQLHLSAHCFFPSWWQEGSEHF